jgi:hypothetical protein
LALLSLVAVASGCTRTPSGAPANFRTTTVPAPAPTPVEIAFRLENHAAIAGFEDVVRATLNDPRGWTRAGFAFVERPDAPYRIVLGLPDDVEALCRPYDVFRKYSCQNGPVVALSAERWRHATPQWTGDLAAYRQMLVDHEVGHLLGLHHPAVQCPAPGQAAPVMAQQSTELGRCLPNPWPLAGEVARAARHDLPLAPPFPR